MNSQQQTMEKAQGVLGALLRNFHKSNAEKAKRRLCSKCDDERPVVCYDDTTGNVEVVQASQLVEYNKVVPWITPDILKAIESMQPKDILVVLHEKNGDTLYVGFKN